LTPRKLAAKLEFLIAILNSNVLKEQQTGFAWFRCTLKARSVIFTEITVNCSF